MASVRELEATAAAIRALLADGARLTREAHAKMRQYDRDGNGTLSTAEFAAFMADFCANHDIPPLDADLLRESFEELDEQKSGSLSYATFEPFVKEMIEVSLLYVDTQLNAARAREAR